MPEERGRQARKATEALLPDGGHSGRIGNVDEGRLNSLPGSRGDLVRLYDAARLNVVGLLSKIEARDVISGARSAVPDPEASHRGRVVVDGVSLWGDFCRPQ